MQLIKNSIRNRILFTFLVFTVVLFLLLIISYLYLNRVEQLNDIKTNFSQNESEILQLINLDNKIKTRELKNPDFYQETNAEVLNTRLNKIKSIRESADKILVQLSSEDIIDVQQIFKVKQLLNEYDSLFNYTIALSIERGFKDFGKVGELRKYAHLIEDSCSDVKASDILMLRRHEKDFLLRGEEKYPKNFNKLIDTLIKEKSSNKSSQSLAYLNNYKKSFNELVSLENLIGGNSGKGLNQQLDLLTNAISLEYSLLAVEFKNKIKENLLRLRVLYTVSCLVILILSVLLSYSTSNRLAKPIQKLSKKMNDFILQKNISKPNLKPDKRNPEEIQNLTRAYLKMINQIRRQYDQIEEKSVSLENQNIELVKLNQELDRFIYSTSHDLRSPLASLLGLISLTKEEQNKEEQLEYLHLMEKNVKSLDGTITEIVNYYKNKNTEVEFEVFKLKKFCEDLIDNFRFQQNAKNFNFIFDINPEFKITTDKTRLKIILENLISNSIRYFDPLKEKPYLKVTAKSEKNKVHIAFEDNGVGIPAEYQKKVFAMFFRANNSITGSGLGLYLVKEAVQKIKGEISLESQEGMGTTFHITFYDAISTNAKTTDEEIINQLT